jgi:hypothetical protein
MSALPLFDSVLLAATGNAPATGPVKDRVAYFCAQLVRSALTDLAEIESLDKGLAPSDGDPFDPQSAVLLRGMYEQWTRDADAVLERVAKVERMGVAVAAAEELRDAQGRLLAMIQVTLDDVEKGRRLFRQGRTWTREEIRGELGLGVQ